MIKEIDCPSCGGTGELEDRKGNYLACKYCKGKGIILENVDDTEETDRADERNEARRARK